MARMRDPNWTGPGPGPWIDVADDAAAVTPGAAPVPGNNTPPDLTNVTNLFMGLGPRVDGAVQTYIDEVIGGARSGKYSVADAENALKIIGLQADQGMTGKYGAAQGVVAVPPASNDPAAPPPPAAPVLDAWGRDPSNPNYGLDLTVKKTDARVAIRAMLAKYGIESLFGTVWDNYTNDTVDFTDEAAVTLSIRETDAYKTRFQGNEVRRKKGLPDLSPSTYIAIEDSYKNSLKVNGIPDSFYDSPEEMAELIGGNVDVQEFNDRLKLARSIAQDAPPEVMNQLTSMYGITEGQLTAYYLNPEKMLPILKEQERSARIGAAAVESGGMFIDKQTAEDLAKRGTTDAQAAAGFGNIAKLGELTQTMGGEDSISNQDIVGAQFGFNADGTKQLANRKARRLAEFAGGGNFAKSQGIGGAIKTGIGSAE